LGRGVKTALPTRRITQGKSQTQARFMKTKIQSPFLTLACLIMLHSSCLCLHAQNTVFTYQGRVTDNGTNFTGAGQFEFALVTSTMPWCWSRE
jgi:hypothetical protein